MKKLTISCKKAGELIEKKNEDKLSFFDSIQLRSHSLFCAACRMYEKQSSLINSFLKREAPPVFDDKDVEDIKKKILNQGISEDGG